MGELVPILLAILAILVVASAIYLRKALSLRQVVKPVEEMDMVERIKIHLNPARTKALITKLQSALEESGNTTKPVVIDHPDTGDRIIRFIISSKQ